jgi:ABC-type branched-subunit amino acid transport system substrate-binding protein
MLMSKSRAAAGALCALLAATSLRAADELVVGMSAAFSGPSAGLGTELYRGSMACFEEVNRTGGVRGRKIVLRAYDDGYNPVPAVANTVRLIEQDDAFVLFGYVGTPTVTRVLPLLKRYEGRSTHLFCPFTGAEPQRRPPYDALVFNLRASYHEETAGLVNNFVKVGRQRIAVFYQIDAYGRCGWEGVRDALKKHELRMTGEATYKRGTKFTASMKEQVGILREGEPDAVICIGAYAACAAFVRDARDAGWGVPIANVSFVGSESLLALLAEAGQQSGKDYTGGLINSQVVPSYHDTDLPAVRRYRELMDRHKPMPPEALRPQGYKPLPYSFVSFEGYLNAALLVEALRKMGDRPERARFREVMESLDRVDLGLDEPVSFGPKKHQGSGQVYYTVVEDGRFVTVKEWERWRK